MLNAAHRGYNYQDLLVAVRLVDMLLGTLTAINVDEKLVPDDRFDDLTTVDLSGARARTQFKHREDATVPLPASTFTSDDRGLRLDHLVACAIADRDGPGATAGRAMFRLVVRDARPTDALLARVLVPDGLDPGPFVPGMHSVRLRFVPELLWPTGPDLDPGTGTADQFAFVRGGRLRREDVVWFCERTVIEVEAPAASFDLIQPGPAEALLLERVRREVGAETYPNAHRSAVDVARSIITAAQAYRQHTAPVSLPDLLRRTQLRQDFGAVARAHPVDSSAEIQRGTTVEEVIRAATTAADGAKPLVLVGPPGQGKSWACHQVTSELTARGWLVAEHYCFLGDSDPQRAERVLADAVFGSLLKRLADQVPDLVTDQRPRFAADEQALERALYRVREATPERRVALVVDGLDHVTRVHGATSGRADPSRIVADELAALELPRGCTLIVFSQHGAHLSPLKANGADSIALPGFGADELRELAQRTGALEQPRRSSDAPPGSVSNRVDEEQHRRFVLTLERLSAGNALYATYLCREIVRHPLGGADPAALLDSLPVFDGTLHNYYSYLVSTLDSAQWVADILGLLDFAVTNAELRDMRPDLAHRIDAALDRLAPVLVERAAQGGIRIYHESFARFLRGSFQQAPQAATAILNDVATWLNQQGFFQNARAFRFLLPTLARAGRYAEVLELIGPDFGSRAVAGGFMASAIRANLATAAGCAAKLRDWASLVRCVELARAAESYQDERLESKIVDFVDIPMSLLGAREFAERLLFDGQTTVPARVGIQLCAAIDAGGDAAPWAEYMEALVRESEHDKNTSYGEQSDQNVRLAWLRGRLRTAAQATGARPVRLERVAEWVREHHAPAPQVVNALIDTLGDASVVEFIGVVSQPSEFALAFAERLVTRADRPSREASLQWATTSLNAGATPGTLHRLLRLGVPLSSVPRPSEPEARAQLLELTRNVVNERIHLEPGPIHSWLDACALAAHLDLFGLATAEALLDGEGWFRCWLRFVVGLSRAEARPVPEHSSAVVAALHLLEHDLRPFVGTPRACDLYGLHDVIAETLRRALALVDDQDWSEALRVLHAVSDGTAVTIRGEMSGPLRFDLLLDLIIKETTPSRRDASAVVVSAIQQERAHGRFYSDVAGFHLSAARLALASGDLTRVREEWRSACTLLVAYGWHKDVTIYELLDPLEALVSKDLGRARECIAMAQPLCERVVEHTDGKETRHAPARWWELLAVADPTALSRTVVPALLARCNMPRTMLERARTDLWLKQHRGADPFVAGILRLTLPTTLVADDPVAVSALADFARARASASVERLTRLLLSRADERPTTYSVTNDSDLLARDDEHVRQLNAVASKIGAPSIQVSSRTAHRGTSSDGRTRTNPPGVAERLELLLLEDFGAGPASLAKVLRAWRRRPYRAQGDRWSSDRFSNAIGYRLLEAVEVGHFDDAVLAVRTLADSVTFGEDDGLLAGVASGLEARGAPELAVRAYALAWTRSRGGGGWLTFGGLTSLDSLRRAAALDPQATLEIVAEEVEDAVLGARGLFGISQALVYAFAEIDFGTTTIKDSQSSVDVAFSCWLEAAQVIQTRTPRLHPHDDPDFPYTAPALHIPAATSHDLEVALAATAIAGAAHPGREQKRRTLVALDLLVAERPVIAGEALAYAIEAVSDPLTLSWMLAVLQGAGSAAHDVLRLCADQLRRLTQRPHLAVRALAARLLREVGLDAPAPPVGSPDPQLFASGDDRLWTPLDAQVAPGEPDTEPAAPDDDDAPSRDSDRASLLVDGIARARLSRCERVVPGITQAVKTRVGAALADDSHRQRMERQLELLSSRAHFRLPDAMLDPTEVVETTLQLVGGDARAAAAAAGKVLSDPCGWEYRVAKLILNDPRLALALEAVRRPRPDIEPPPGPGASVWQAGRDCSPGQRESELTAPPVGHSLAFTVRVVTATDAPVVADGLFAGWRVLASVERRDTPASLSKDTDAHSFRYCGVEHGMLDPTGAFLPLAHADTRVWFVPPPQRRLVDELGEAALIGIDTEGPAIGDGRDGLGLPNFVLAPALGLVALLRLRPGPNLLELVDDVGPAMALTTWCAAYIVSDYELARPLLSGAYVSVRPDLFAQLVAIGAERLVWREYITGDVSKAYY